MALQSASPNRYYSRPIKEKKAWTRCCAQRLYLRKGLFDKSMLIAESSAQSGSADSRACAEDSVDARISRGMRSGMVGLSGTGSRFLPIRNGFRPFANACRPYSGNSETPMHHLFCGISVVFPKSAVPHGNPLRISLALIPSYRLTRFALHCKCRMNPEYFCSMMEQPKQSPLCFDVSRFL